MWANIAIYSNSEGCYFKSFLITWSQMLNGETDEIFQPTKGVQQILCNYISLVYV